MKSNLVISSSLIKVMREERRFRTNGYSLHAGFAGEYTTTNVVPYRTRNYKGDEEADLYRIECKSESGVHDINGFLFNNAIVVEQGVTVPDAQVKEGDEYNNVVFFDQAEEMLRKGFRVNTLMEDTEDFRLPEKFHVIGAMVSREKGTDHPYIPLTRYPFYRTILAHHQKKVPGALYLTRDEIDGYLHSENGVDGLPKNYKFQLPDEEIWNVRNWNPTLIIEDWRDE